MSFPNLSSHPIFPFRFLFFNSFGGGADEKEGWKGIYYLETITQPGSAGWDTTADGKRRSVILPFFSA